MNGYTTHEHSQWANEVIQKASYPCDCDVSARKAMSEADTCHNCKGFSHIHYTGMTDYLERHSGAWPSPGYAAPAYTNDFRFCYAIRSVDGPTNPVLTSDGKILSHFVHALPYLGSDGKNGLLDILRLEFGWHFDRKDTWDAICWEAYPKRGAVLTAATLSALMDKIREVMP